MVNTIVAECDVAPTLDLDRDLEALPEGSTGALARVLTALEVSLLPADALGQLRSSAASRVAPVVGITGTGGSGKSSLTDELLLRLQLDQQDKVRVAVLAVDPSRRRAGGALLGDRIRMAVASSPQVFFRSIATRGATEEVPPSLHAMIDACRVAGFDLIVIETPGIGQRDAAITALADVSVYVMTPEYGAASQLEKIDMLDLAHLVVINKFERRGAEDALRDVRRQVARNRGMFGTVEDLPVFGSVAARFNDDGVTAVYQHLRGLLRSAGAHLGDGLLEPTAGRVSTQISALVPPSRVRYLAEVADTVRRYHDDTDERAAAVRRLDALREVAAVVPGADLDAAVAAADAEVDRDVLELLAVYDADVERLTGADGPARESLSGTRVPRIALPRFGHRDELYQWLRRENLPGRFPYTAGVFAMKRDDEDPTRMFAGEGGPARTNRRFHLLADGQPATRLSTAFDSVTLYGADPDERPDIYGKVGTSGVSIATLDDMKVLYDGFDLIDPSTSVSMTINGPAPAILAMFLNTAIDQHPELDQGEILQRVRGTVQADILKEDQGQNTCILSTDFALRMMADIQEWFIEHAVRRFYSVSISGYHIAEAGANPISQLAFTLANGFTYVEAYLARGMAIDDFAPNLSFFFSNGLDPEYTVLGRVARRIWAIALRDRYGADERSQRLKYHIQTSGRSLHAQDIAFNDIRTTLQALCAIYDNANSLHTNAYDEAITTPTDESVRRAMAIQLIINREWGLAENDNPLQGAFIVEELTALVEEAVLRGTRSHQRSRRRSRRDGDRLPARSHPGRVDALRAAQARRHPAHHRREHFPEPERRRAAGRRAPSRRQRGEGRSDKPVARIQDDALQRARSGTRAPSRGRPARCQHLRRAHGHSPPLHARRDHRRALPGRRSLPPQRVIAAGCSQKVVACRSPAGSHSGARRRSASCTNEATSRPSRVKTCPRPYARPPPAACDS